MLPYRGESVASVWITYAWEDNASGDVDFVAQELEQVGISVKLDRWNIQAGKRLWPQIERFIQDPAESGAWLLYATEHSLGSEACKEEFAYALDRTLKSRGGEFPVIGLFPSPVDDGLIPAGIRTRLYVSTTDPNWKERIKAALEGRAPQVDRPQLEPYSLSVHKHTRSGRQCVVIEVRPRAGTWSPFLAAVPLSEKEALNPSIYHGPRGRIPSNSVLFHSGSGPSKDGQWWIMFAQNEATPTQSYFVFCDRPPARLVFGVYQGQPQYTVPLGGV